MLLAELRRRQDAEMTLAVLMQEVPREMMPFYLPLIITRLLITYAPAITVWLPHWAMGGPWQ